MLKTKAVTITEEQISELNAAYPISEESNRLQLPRFGCLSKDIVEETGTGKNKKITIIQPSGTFFTESDEGEVNEDGKKVWTKTYLEGETQDVQICYPRRQLRKFDSSLKKFISSPIFDNGEQVIPLYLDKQVIQRGTQAQLQKLYPALTQKGKPTSDLREETILYVIYNDELHQMNLSQSSKWEFKSYAKSINPSIVVTTLGSVEETFGKNTYRKVTFKSAGLINNDQFKMVKENQAILKATVEADQKFYLAAGTPDKDFDKEATEIEASATKATEIEASATKALK
jgi:hypothetical protein